jgi:hypothetical protein
MIETCANSACAVPFRYWRGGRLFRFDVKSPPAPCRDVPHHICQQRPATSSVFFWLCENCCLSMVLRFDQHKGLAVVPLGSTDRASGIVARPDAQELSA